MKNKKGFMLGEYTLKIIIAVLCLLLLVYLLFSLYNNSKEERDLKLAKATLEDLGGKMEKAKEDGSIENVALLNPQAYSLGYWNQGEKGPEGCYGNCLCLCGTYTRTDWLGGNRIERCTNPICKHFDYQLFITDGAVWTIPADVKISFAQNKFTITKNG